MLLGKDLKKEFEASKAPEALKPTLDKYLIPDGFQVLLHVTDDQQPKAYLLPASAASESMSFSEAGKFDHAFFGRSSTKAENNQAGQDLYEMAYNSSPIANKAKTAEITTYVNCVDNEFKPIKGTVGKITWKPTESIIEIGGLGEIELRRGCQNWAAKKLAVVTQIPDASNVSSQNAEKALDVSAWG